MEKKMNRSIDHDAPVVERADIFIATDPKQVWDILADIEHWPSWQSDVTKAQLLDPLEEQATFKWKAGGLPFTSIIHTFDPPTAIGWTGKTYGTSAVHNWSLKKAEKGTIVEVSESLRGIFPFLFRKWFSNMLENGLQKNLVELKMESEKRSSG